MELAVGQVFWLRCQTCKTPKPKLHIIAMVDPMLCFLINSVRTEFQLAREPHIAATPPIFQADHSFLDHDSYIGCNELFAEHTADSILSVMARNPRTYVGELHENARL